MLPNVIAFVPAAGRGLRFANGQQSKLLLELEGRSIIEHTLARICSALTISKIFVMTRAADISVFSDLLKAFPRTTVITGGASRRDSVSNAVAHTKQFCSSPDNTYVLIHDGARCLISKDLIERSIEAAFEHQAVSVGLPLSDSIKLVNGDGNVHSSLDRSKYWVVQTPQVFRFDLLIQAHEANPEDATDDVALVEKIHPVHILEGEKTNIKITTKEDLALARAYMKVLS